MGMGAECDSSEFSPAPENRVSREVGGNQGNVGSLALKLDEEQESELECSPLGAVVRRLFPR